MRDVWSATTCSLRRFSTSSAQNPKPKLKFETSPEAHYKAPKSLDTLLSQRWESCSEPQVPEPALPSGGAEVEGASRLNDAISCASTVLVDCSSSLVFVLWDLLAQKAERPWPTQNADEKCSIVDSCGQHRIGRHRPPNLQHQTSEQLCSRCCGCC